MEYLLGVTPGLSLQNYTPRFSCRVNLGENGVETFRYPPPPGFLPVAEFLEPPEATLLGPGLQPPRPVARRFRPQDQHWAPLLRTINDTDFPILPHSIFLRLYGSAEEAEVEEEVVRMDSMSTMVRCRRQVAVVVPCDAHHVLRERREKGEEEEEEAEEKKVEGGGGRKEGESGDTVHLSKPGEPQVIHHGRRIRVLSPPGRDMRHEVRMETQIIAGLVPVTGVRHALICDLVTIADRYKEDFKRQERSSDSSPTEQQEDEEEQKKQGDVAGASALTIDVQRVNESEDTKRSESRGFRHLAESDTPMHMDAGGRDKQPHWVRLALPCVTSGKGRSTVALWMWKIRTSKLGRPQKPEAFSHFPEVRGGKVSFLPCPLATMDQPEEIYTNEDQTGIDMEPLSSSMSGGPKSLEGSAVTRRLLCPTLRREESPRSPPPFTTIHFEVRILRRGFGAVGWMSRRSSNLWSRDEAVGLRPGAWGVALLGLGTCEGWKEDLEYFDPSRAPLEESKVQKSQATLAPIIAVGGELVPLLCSESEGDGQRGGEGKETEAGPLSWDRGDVIGCTLIPAEGAVLFQVNSTTPERRSWIADVRVREEGEGLRCVTATWRWDDGEAKDVFPSPLASPSASEPRLHLSPDIVPAVTASPALAVQVNIGTLPFSFPWKYLGSPAARALMAIVEND